jgi:Outer membrane protein and related peptidoglycan-associated (lipo)proteins
MDNGADDLEEAEGGPWPAFADLLAATTLLFLVLFTVGALPAIKMARERGAAQIEIKELTAALVPKKESDRYTVRAFPDYLLIRIKGDATFPKGMSNIDSLREEGKVILRDLATSLLRDSLMRHVEMVQVAGHTSSEGSDQRNWLLSSERASSVALYLIEKGGLDPCKVTALGRGRYYPVSPELPRTEQGRPEDRRIEIEIRPVATTQKTSDTAPRCVN